MFWYKAWVIYFYTYGQEQRKIAGISDNSGWKAALCPLNMMIWPVRDQSLPVFFYSREKTIRNRLLQQTEMHPLWTSTINRPAYRRIVHSMNHSDWCIWKSMVVCSGTLSCCAERLSIIHINKVSRNQTMEFIFRNGMKYEYIMVD